MSYATFSTLSTQERFTPAYYKWQKPSLTIRDFIKKCQEGKEKLPAVVKVEMTTDLKRRSRSKGLLGAGEVSVTLVLIEMCNEISNAFLVSN